MRVAQLINEGMNLTIYGEADANAAIRQLIMLDNNGFKFVIRPTTRQPLDFEFSNLVIALRKHTQHISIMRYARKPGFEEIIGWAADEEQMANIINTFVDRVKQTYSTDGDDWVFQLAVRSL